MRRLMMISVTAALVACGKSSPTAARAPIPNIAGSWSGTVSVTPTLHGTLALTLTQTPAGSGFPDYQSLNMLTGTWSTVFANTADNSSGIVAGTVASDSVIQITLQPSVSQGTCSLNVSATLTGMTSMSGRIDAYTYSAPNHCAIASTWQFIAGRQ